MSAQFYLTRRLFRDYIGYQGSLSYQDWMNLPDDRKVAGLYCNFFDQIVFAWYKSKSFYAEEEEGVETVLQYLTKNVPIIQKNSKKYSESYIYRVAYNCLYCISHDRKCDRDRYEKEMSNIVMNGDTELDIFHTCRDSRYSPEYIFFGYQNAADSLWGMIEGMDEDTKSVIENIYCGHTLPKGFSRKRKYQIIEDLKKKFEEAGFKAYFYDYVCSDKASK